MKENKERFIKMYWWMRELGLGPDELVIFASIHHYTVFKGFFDGDRIWLSRWLGGDLDRLDTALASLIEKGLAVASTDALGCKRYKSTILGGPSRTRTSIEKINIKESIDSIDCVKDSIDSVKEKNKDSIDKDSVEKESPKKRTDYTDEEIKEIIAPYEDITDVPFELLAKKVQAFDERKARMAGA